MKTKETVLLETCQKHGYLTVADCYLRAGKQFHYEIMMETMEIYANECLTDYCKSNEINIDIPVYDNE